MGFCHGLFLLATSYTKHLESVLYIVQELAKVRTSHVLLGYVLFASTLFNLLLVSWTVSGVDERKRALFKVAEVAYECLDLIARFATIVVFMKALGPRYDEVHVIVFFDVAV